MAEYVSFYPEVLKEVELEKRSQLLQQSGKYRSQRGKDVVKSKYKAKSRYDKAK